MDHEEILYQAYKEGLASKVFKKASKIKTKTPNLSTNELYQKAYSKVKKKYEKNR